MATALQIVPAGARQIAPGVFQQRGRRGGGRIAHRGRRHPGRARSRHGFFAKQWVWFAIALILGEVLDATLFAGAPAWLSVPGLFLIGYGYTKKKPGAINAGLAIVAWRYATQSGVVGTLKQTAKQMLNVSMQTGGGGGGGGGGGSTAQDTADAVAMLAQLNQMGVV